MEFEEYWKKMGQQQDVDLNKILLQENFRKKTSGTVLQKIKMSLIANMIFGIIICLAYVYILIRFQLWPVQATLSVVLIFSLWAIATAWKQFRNLSVHVSPDASLLEELKRHHSSIADWMKTQQLVALFIYPISAAGGFMLGGFIGSGKPIEDWITRPYILLALAISLVVLVPTCYFFAKWMFHMSFGRKLKELHAQIEQLEAINREG
jgi:hypothetical protein